MRDFRRHIMRIIELIQVVTLLIFVSTGCSAGDKSLTKNSNGWKNMNTKHSDIFLREYPPEHLKQHPHQTIQTILIYVNHFPLGAKKNIEDKESIDITNDDKDQATAFIYVKHKNTSAWYGQGGTCKKPVNSDMYDCYVDGDGGQFTLKLEKNMQLILTGRSRLEKCGVEWEEIASTDDTATTSLNNNLGEEEIYWLNQIDESSFSKKLKNSQCI